MYKILLNLLLLGQLISLHWIYFCATPLEK